MCGANLEASMSGRSAQASGLPLLASWGARAVLLLGMWCVLAPAGAASNAWRSEAARIRVVAENDPARAYVQAQQLLKGLPADATPAQRAQVWNLLARIEIYLALSDQAAQHIQLALDLATPNEDRIGIGEAELNSSMNSVNQARMEVMISSTIHAQAMLDGVDQPELVSEALMRTSVMYRRVGKFDESVAAALQALEVAQRSRNQRALVHAHHAMAISFDQSGRPKEGREHYQRMRDAARAAPARLWEAYAVMGMANTTLALGDARGGEALLRECIVLFREVGAPFGINHGLFALADRLRIERRFDEAMPLLDQVIANYERHPNNIGRWYTLNARSAIHLSMGRRSAAVADAEKAYALAKEMGTALYLSESAQRIAAIGAAGGDYRSAYRYSLEATELTAKAARERNAARMLELTERYKAENKQRQIDQLTRRNTEQAVALRQRQLQQGWLATILIASVAVLLIITYFLLRQRRSHAIIRDLNTGLEQRVLARTAQLRQQTRYLRTLIDALPWWVWLKDTQSRYLAVNQAAADTCGLSTEALVGKSDPDIRPPELAAAFLRDDREVMASRSGKMVEELQLVDGRRTWMETFKAPVLDEDGTVLGTVGFARDISERKSVDEAREMALAEAQRLASVRSEFLAQMSHELRTPLNGILGYAQVLRRDSGLDHRHMAGLDVIQQSGEHLLSLINDVLDLAKIEAGKLELESAAILLPRFLHDICAIIALKAEQKALAFECVCAPDLPAMILADERRLRQVLLNLLANAVKFTDRGQVRLDVSRTPAARLRFEVRDSGVGIGPDQTAAIFQPFEQSGEPQRRLSGTGLGLAIVRQFVGLMGGEVQVESVIGQGSRFWFELELVDGGQLAAAAPPARHVSGYRGPRQTVLVVDDVAANRAVLVDMLERLGFCMVAAQDGATALELAAAQPPDLVLMDIVMPQMDGLEATRRLRALPGLAALPVIAVSASASAHDRERYLAAGLNAFLPKPVDYDSLLAQVAAQLSLEWIGEWPAGAAPRVHAQALQVPDASEMEELHRLARMGNMQDILAWAARMAGLGQCYQPFADQVAALARGYQSKAILRLVQGYLDGAGPEPQAACAPDAVRS
jgi:PAS domain S-box-containing protein